MIGIAAKFLHRSLPPPPPALLAVKIMNKICIQREGDGQALPIRYACTFFSVARSDPLPPSSSSSTRPKPQLPAWNDNSPPSSPVLSDDEAFRYDLYEKDLLDQFYDGAVGPTRIKFAVRWPLSVKGAKVDQLEEIMYTHGIWPNAKVLTIEQMQHIAEDYIDQVPKEYEQYVLKYWPNVLHDPRSLASARWTLKGWKRHGLPAGMSLKMYLFYGLAFRAAFPDSFGITVGKPMKLKEASEQVNEVMKNLELFGEHVGRDVYAEIRAVIDPNNVYGPRIIQEIRPQFIRILEEGKAKWRPDNVDLKVRYSGDASSGENIVILPSSKL